ncbi:MAG TPA: hypothetical protein VGM98_06640, partial [Schlesneria sp.]
MDRVSLAHFSARMPIHRNSNQNDPDGRGRPMRSGIHGTFATLLLMVPVLSIPALAIFGIPQFAPVVASPLDEGPDEHHEKRVGKSERPDDDMLGDLGHAPDFGSEPNDARTGTGRMGDSVPLPRGRNSGNRETSFDARQRSQPGTTPRSSWQDEPRGDLHRPVDDLDGGMSRSNQTDPPKGQLKDLRFDAQPTLPEFKDARIQNTVMPKSQDPQNPRMFQRGRLPETSETRTPSRPEETFSWQDAVNRLNELEIRNFRLQPGNRENQYAFVCNYTPSDSPRVSYRFEAEADE